MDACGLRRIYFYRGHGVAQSRWDGPIVHLEAAPDLGFPFVELDFEPSLQVFQVRPTNQDSLRDMVAQERAACVEYLDGLHK